MQNINRRFIDIQSSNPNWGDYIVLEKAVRGQNYSKSIIKRAFKLWIKDCPKYGIKETEVLVNYLFERSITNVK